MASYYVTFGQKYRREPHPVLGMMPELPDGYYIVEAEDYREACDIAISCFGRAFCAVYPLEGDRSIYSEGALGFLTSDNDKNKKSLRVKELYCDRRIE